MLLKSWNNIELICGNHTDEEIQMKIHEGKEGSSPFYACPRYVSIYLKSNERSCNNRLSITELEKLLKHLNEKAVNPDSPNNNNLTGYTWSSRGIDYKVLEHKNGKFKVSVLNRKAMAK